MRNCFVGLTSVNIVAKLTCGVAFFLLAYPFCVLVFHCMWPAYFAAFAGIVRGGYGS